MDLTGLSGYDFQSRESLRKLPKPNYGRREVRIVRLGIALAAVLSAELAAAGEPFFLQGGETVVFFGDDVTEEGGYIRYVETFLRTRFPDKQFRLINAGLNGETITGTTEPGYHPSRPNADRRFARDVAAQRPDVVVACFGMNDGNFLPFDLERYQLFQIAVRRLQYRVKHEAEGATLILMTPPPFDPFRRQVADPKAGRFGYHFPALDYDQTLERYSNWLISLRPQGQLVVDQHAALKTHLEARRRQKVSFYLSKDGIHLGPTGHWLMAQQLLEAWHAPGLVAEADLDAADTEVRRGAVRDLGRDGRAIRFRWRAGLPIPFDPQWDPESIVRAEVSERLNRYWLRVTGLSAQRYWLLADGNMVTQLAREELQQGIDLTRQPELPANREARQVLELVGERQRTIYAQWRDAVALEKRPDEKTALHVVKAAEKACARLDQQLQQLCAIRETEYRLEPVAKIAE